MSLWGKTDATESKPKYLSTADKANTVFVSAEEAVLKTNKDKGITGAGWWLTKNYTDADGNKRYKSELLVAMGVANSVSSDAADDATVADAEVTITITTQPANQTTISGGATFGITASVSSGTLTYQWQKKAVAAGSRWADISGATSATRALTGQLAANTGDQYRVVMQSTSGAAAVTSSVATLTFGS
jgi:hypothetical protein